MQARSELFRFRRFASPKWPPPKTDAPELWTLTLAVRPHRGGLRAYLLQQLHRQRLELEVVAGVEQDRAVRDGDDLRHQRAHDDVVAGLALGRTDLPHAVGIVRDRHEDVEAGVDVEVPAVHAVAAHRRFEVGLAVGRALPGLAVARDIEVLAAIAAAAIVLAGKILLDVPHLARAVAVEHVRRSELPVEVDGAARMHRQELACVVAVERDQVGDLLALGLGELEPLSCLDLEADIARGRQRHRLTQHEDSGGTAHGGYLC